MLRPNLHCRSPKSIKAEPLCLRGRTRSAATLPYLKPYDTALDQVPELSSLTDHGSYLDKKKNNKIKTAPAPLTL